jgi:hypothetical protein
VLGPKTCSSGAVAREILNLLGDRSIFESHEIGKRDPVMRRLKRLLVPITYDQSMYVNEGAADVWEVQAQYGFKSGISLRLESDGGKHFVIGVDREQPLPDDCVQLTRMTADLCLFAAYAQVAALRLLGGADHCHDELPPLTLRKREVLKWTVDGKSARAVGQILSTNEHTVNDHLRRIRENSRWHRSFRRWQGPGRFV